MNIHAARNRVCIALNAAVFEDHIPVDTSCSTHTLRHSATRHWINSKVRINQACVRIRHINLATTVTFYLPITGAGKEAMALVT